MNYTIVSKSGWRAGAQTEADARTKAETHRQQWAEIGRDIDVRIYYRDGTECPLTRKEPR